MSIINLFGTHWTPYKIEEYASFMTFETLAADLEKGDVESDWWLIHDLIKELAKSYETIREWDKLHKETVDELKTSLDEMANIIKRQEGEISRLEEELEEAEENEMSWEDSYALKQLEENGGLDYLIEMEELARKYGLHKVRTVGDEMALEKALKDAGL